MRQLSAFLCVICIGLAAGSVAFARDARLDYLVGQGLVTEDQVAAAETEGPSNWMAPKAYDVVIEGYVQTRWAYKDGGDPDNAFSVKRSELKLAGKLGDGWAIVAAFDPASSSIVKDCYVGYTSGDASVKLGQLKPALVLENMTSSSKLDTIERSKIAGKVNERDIGAYLDYAFLEGKAGVNVGVANGTGGGNKETNDAKDYIACVWTKPFKGSEGPADGLMLRAAASTGDQQELDEEDVDLGDFQRTIWIGTVVWDYAPFKVQGEYVNIDQDVAAGGSESTDGWYVLALYEMPLDSMKVAPVVKYEQLDGSGGDWITLGVRVAFVGTHDVKLEANYIIESLDEGEDADQFIIQLQAKF